MTLPIVTRTRFEPARLAPAEYRRACVWLSILQWLQFGGHPWEVKVSASEPNRERKPNA